MARKLKAEIDLDTARAKRRSQELKKSMRDFGKEGKDATKAVGRGTEELAGKTGVLGQAVMGLVGAYAGMRGVTMIMQSLARETEAIDRATRSALESMRGVMALSSVAGRRQQEQQAMWQLAAFARRPMEEIAPAYYTLLGGTFGMAPERQKGLMQQAALWARTDPTASLQSLVNMISTMGAQQPGLTPQQIGNLASYTIEAAKAQPTEMAGALPRVLSTAGAVGAEVSLPMALFSFISRQTGDPHTAATAARAILFGLGKPAPAMLKQMRRFGFQPGAPMLERLQWLGQVGAKLPEQVQLGLGGRRGVLALGPLAKQPEIFAQTLEETRGALAAPGSLFQQRLAGMYGEMPAQRALDQLQQIEILTPRERFRPEVMGRQRRLEFIKLYELKRGYPPYLRDARAAGRKAVRDLGLRAMPQAAHLEAMFDLLEEGYEPAQMLDIIYPTLEFKPRPFPDMQMFLDPGAAKAGFLERFRELLKEKGAAPMGEIPTTQPTSQPSAPESSMAPIHYHIGNYYAQPAGDLARNPYSRIPEGIA